MSSIELTVGPSCSGKTSYAVERVANSKGKLINSNRDDIRFTMFAISDYSNYKFTKEREQMVTDVQFAMAEAALKVGKGIIVSDTNLEPSRWVKWKELAKQHNICFRIKYFSEDYSVLLERNLHRGRSTCPKVIKMQFDKFEQNSPTHINYWTPKPYVNPTEGRKCWIVDIDGTLAHMDGLRGAFDYSKVGLDRPDQHVIDLVNMLYGLGHRIIIMSGREDSCFDETVKWLMKHKVKYDQLYMRKSGDQRKDNIVKDEMFIDHIEPKGYIIQGVLDDRNQVVSMWRKKGLKVFQVEDGDF